MRSLGTSCELCGSWSWPQRACRGVNTIIMTFQAARHDLHPETVVTLSWGGFLRWLHCDLGDRGAAGREAPRAATGS